jgi:hypothetical protein
MLSQWRLLQSTAVNSVSRLSVNEMAIASAFVKNVKSIIKVKQLWWVHSFHIMMFITVETTSELLSNE